VWSHAHLYFEVWQRFTQSARKAVIFAQEEAQQCADGFVSPEHLLLALLRDPKNNACHVLRRRGLTPLEVRSRVQTLPALQELGCDAGVALSPEAKRALDSADEEARRFEHNYVGTEHILLGLIRESHGPLASLLHDMNLSIEPARTTVAEFLQEATKAVRVAKTDA
jgi:ATP-dependent Clp protease ATP-binding subunit ClpC